MLSASARNALLRLGDDWDEIATVLLNAAEFVDYNDEHISPCEIHLAALQFESSICFFNGM